MHLCYFSFSCFYMRVGFPRWLNNEKNSPASKGDAGDVGSISGSGRSPGERNCNLLQYSCMKNPMDRGAWQATVHEVGAKSRRRLSGHTRMRVTFLFPCFTRRVVDRSFILGLSLPLQPRHFLALNSHAMSIYLLKGLRDQITRSTLFFLHFELFCMTIWII